MRQCPGSAEENFFNVEGWVNSKTISDVLLYSHGFNLDTCAAPALRLAGQSYLGL